MASRNINLNGTLNCGFKKTKLSIALIVLMTATSSVYATEDVYDAAVVAAVADTTSAVSAGASSIVEQILSTENVLNTTLGDMGNTLISEFKTQNELLGTLTKTQLTTMRDLMVQQEVARAKERAIQIYGDQGTDTDCLYEELGRSMAQGRKQMAASTRSSGQSMEQRSRHGSGTKGGKQKTDDLLKIPEDKIVLIDIYPEKKVLTDEQEQLVRQINEHIIDPFPPNKISDKLKNSTGGQAYEATRLNYEKEKSAPRQAQSEILSLKTNDFPVNQWATDAWKEMGNSGVPDGVIDNKMSYESFLDLFVKSRIDNDKWYQKVTGAGAGGEGGNDVWQLRQITMNTAMLLEIQNRQLQLMTRLVELMAQNRANDIDEKRLHQLDELLKRVESQQIAN